MFATLPHEMPGALSTLVHEEDTVEDIAGTSLLLVCRIGIFREVRDDLVRQIFPRLWIGALHLDLTRSRLFTTCRADTWHL